MKYDKPGIRRMRTVGQMVYTPSACEAAGGVWIEIKKACDLTP